MEVFASKSLQKHSAKTFVPFKVTTWLWERFHCQHKEMSRPITRDGETYRACVKCGARRPFNLNACAMKGSFYFQPKVGDSTLREKSALGEKLTRKEKETTHSISHGEIKSAA